MSRTLAGAVALSALLFLSACGPGGEGGGPSSGADVPTPADVWGFEPGTDYRLADYDQVREYLAALDDASERIVVEEIGRSTLDRPLLLAVISSAENLENLERYRRISERMARARDVDEAEARRLADEGKAVVWIDGGLHATEVAHGQMTPELAWWAATDESPEARRIRENVIFLLMPNMNPDGLDIVVDWYRGNVGTEFETAPVPTLYHHYVGHDNNRDWYMFTQVEHRAVGRQLYHRWYPQIVYNHHQSGPFPGRIWVPPFENPVNPNLDPLVVSSLNHIGEAMKRRFDAEGKPGVSSHIVYDLWWNGSMRGGPDFHNMLGFLSETALYEYATPHCYDEEDIPETFGARAGHLPARRPTTQYTNPWEGGCWHLRDPIEYMLTGSRAVLDQAARFKDDYLMNIWRMGTRQIERAERAEGGPFAYVIDPEAQHDPGTAVELLRTLRKGGVEVVRAERSFEAGGESFEAGVYVIPPQAFRPFVVDLMEPKSYPDRRQYPGGPPEPPYDMTGYELSFQMGVEPVRIAEAFEMPGARVDEIPAADGGAAAEASWGWAIPRSRNHAYRMLNRLLADGATALEATASFRAGGRDWPAGTLLVRGASPDRVRALGEEEGVPARGLAAPPGVETRPLRAPRIGLYRGHTANMPEGWTRWLFEQYAFDYRNVSNDDVRSGRLDEVDVLVLPDQDADDILDGHEPGTMPPEYVGGVGEEGVASIREWVAAGGSLLAMDNSVDFAIEHLGLPVENSVEGLGSSDFFIPGSLLRIRVDAGDPMAYGMPDEAVAFFVRSQGLTVGAGAGTSAAPVRDVTTFARYDPDALLVSGWAHGADDHLAGTAAGVRMSYGEGSVALLAFEPHFRGQPHNTFKLLFNPLYAATAPGTDEGHAPAGR